MCYQQVLTSSALLLKADLLKARVRKLCPAMDESWWERVVSAQRQHVDHWEMHYADAQRGRVFWCNWVTNERRWEKPAECDIDVGGLVEGGADVTVIA